MISYYELLGLIKEGKQPKKIKRYDIIYDWTGYNFYNDDYGHLTEHMNELHMINKDIEIIKDKPEKIEELTICGKTIGYGLMKEWLDFTPNDQEQKLCSAIETEGIAINKLIKAVNYLLEEGKHEN